MVFKKGIYQGYGFKKGHISSKPFLKGNIPWNKGLTKEIDDKIRKLGDLHKTWAPSEITREKMKNAKLKNPTRYWLGKKRPEVSGVNNIFWKGGINKPNMKIRRSSEYLSWRKAIFERDNYTCKICRARSGNGKRVYLEAHHIFSFAIYPELRFDTNNGITLCKICHKKENLDVFILEKLIKVGILRQEDIAINEPLDN